jgi:alkanesulfonate monooxygenase SsuD/methylene tetrahydromethanopterin reductase-like flavin-dependent oxidoreductase (luciferase family)
VSGSLEFGIVLPHWGASWPDTERFAHRVEASGFDSVWVIDHLLGFPPEVGVFEAWTTISALASVTTRVGIGAQVLCQSFRSPALLAKMATTLDLVSGGRLRFLLGAGWFEPEYRAFGYEFPPAGRRVEEMEETLAICRAMFDAGREPVTYRGRHHRIDGVVNVPPPERRIPIGVGCTGNRMLDLVARHADEWNVPALALGSYGRLRDALDERLAATGRQVRRSAQVVFSPGDAEPAAHLRFFKPELGVRGSRAQMLDRVGDLAASGIDGLYGYVADERALDELAEALPELRAVR